MLEKYRPRIVAFLRSCLPDRSIEALDPPSDKFKAVLKRARFFEQIPAAWVIIAVVAGFITWSTLAQIEQFTIAQGRVIPQGNTIFIQHLEGGVVDEVLVEVGDRVTAEQVLFRISLGASNQSREEIAADLAGFLARRTRIKAELEGKEPVFDPEIAAGFPEVVEAELASYNNSQATRDRSINIFESQRDQQKQVVREIEASIKTQTTNLKLNDEKLGLKRELEKEGLVTRLEIIDLEEKSSQINGRISELKAALSSAKLKLGEAISKIAGIDESLTNKNLEDLVRVENGIERLQLTLERYARQEVRREIRAPVDGFVKELLFSQRGGVVRPGESLAEIVPEGKVVLIDARITTAERGKVETGQGALVKVSAYDYFRYGGLEGTVTNISADSFTDQQGSAFYRVTIKTDKTWLGEEEGLLPITPGMEVTADIKTGKRRVIEYIFNPVLKLKHNAFRQ